MESDEPSLQLESTVSGPRSRDVTPVEGPPSAVSPRLVANTISFGGPHVEEVLKAGHRCSSLRGAGPSRDAPWDALQAFECFPPVAEQLAVFVSGVFEWHVDHAAFWNKLARSRYTRSFQIKNTNNIPLLHLGSVSAESCAPFWGGRGSAMDETVSSGGGREPKRAHRTEAK